MKDPISALAAGALALGLLAVPKAEDWRSSGPDVSLRFAGSSTVVDVDEETGDTSTLQILRAKGKRGNSQITSNVVYEPVGPYEGCPVFGAEATANWVARYNDGSILTGAESGIVCTDGSVFTGDVGGQITGTVGRFEDATGTWEAQASVWNSAFTGTLTADFDQPSKRRRASARREPSGRRTGGPRASRAHPDPPLSFRELHVVRADRVVAGSTLKGSQRALLAR